MSMPTLETKLTDVRKIDAKRAAALRRLGLATVRDLLFYFPTRYNDFSTIIPIASLKAHETGTVRGAIQHIASTRTWKKRMGITEAVLTDKSSSMKIIWFNQPYLAKTLAVGDELIVSGKLDMSRSGLAMMSPVFEKYKADSVHTGRIVPVYAETKELTSRWLRFFLKPLLSCSGEIGDALPKNILMAEKLMPLSSAVRAVHYPGDAKELLEARARLAFDEMFLFQLRAVTRRREQKERQAYAVPFDEKKTRALVTHLPFTLTTSQKRAAWDILKDIGRPTPMNRLLEGDVGSGKTVVAALAMHAAAEAGYQSVIMAPTEILAEQHFKTIAKLLIPFGISVGLLTRGHCGEGNTKGLSALTKKEFLKKLKTGKLAVAVGTHTFVQEGVAFKHLALAVVDEQHRFGVRARATLSHMGGTKKSPHFLSMTATPIPRTLALGLWGDLDISIINELPKGRRNILTKVVAPEHRLKAYEFIRGQLVAGRQAFVICPRIEGSEEAGSSTRRVSAEVKAVETEHTKLQSEIFPRYAVGMLHGKLSKEEKSRVMQAFRRGTIHLLVSTSVIEVGIDVPNATIMMIEGAEHFGLAQLHQFRGRVGRGEHQSYCFLFSESNSETTRERLAALTTTANGFELAEIDLKLRGPGELFGTLQSGIPDLQVASLTDVSLIRRTRDAAERVVEADPLLAKNPLLKERLHMFEQRVHLE